MNIIKCAMSITKKSEKWTKKMEQNQTNQF